MKTKIKSIALFFSIAILVEVAFGNDILVTFTPNAADLKQGIVTTYGLWYQPTNTATPNDWKWVYQIQVGTNVNALQMSMQLAASNLPPVCSIAVTADGISQNSYWSAPYLYNYPMLLTNALANAKPNPVTGVGGTLILK